MRRDNLKSASDNKRDCHGGKPPRNDTGVMFRRESLSWLPLTRELLSISETEGEK